MALSQKNNRTRKSPSVITWVILFFFFIVPIIPIFIALISDTAQHQPAGFAYMEEFELTEEGKKRFKGKEFLIEKYLSAANKYQIPWEYLAAIHEIESNFSLSTSPKKDENVTSDTPIEQIKVGPMGFLERNWVGWGDEKNDFFAAYPGARTPRSKDGDLNNSYHSIMVNLDVIKKYKGVGVDGNGDGIADPYNVDDAIFSAAHKLKTDGLDEGNYRRALMNYNRQVGYVEKVRQKANELLKLVRVSPRSDVVVPTGDIKAMIEEAFRQYKTREINYVWGGTNYPNFDCSGWVQYMYRKYLGIELLRVSQDQFHFQGKPVPINQLQPGDLVFFHTNPSDSKGPPSHVGMYVGNGMMIHNANSARDLSYDSLDKPIYKNNYWGARRYTPADSKK